MGLLKSCATLFCGSIDLPLNMIDGIRLFKDASAGSDNIILSVLIIPFTSAINPGLLLDLNPNELMIFSPDTCGGDGVELLLGLLQETHAVNIIQKIHWILLLMIFIYWSTNYFYIGRLLAKCTQNPTIHHFNYIKSQILNNIDGVNFKLPFILDYTVAKVGIPKTSLPGYFTLLTPFLCNETESTADSSCLESYPC